jgi:type I restriction enzyme R subunit
MVERIRQEVAAVGFWKNPHAREMLTRRLVRDLDHSGICNRGSGRALAQQIVALAKENHENLVRP